MPIFFRFSQTKNDSGPNTQQHPNSKRFHRILYMFGTFSKWDKRFGTNQLVLSHYKDRKEIYNIPYNPYKKKLNLILKLTIMISNL